MSDSNRSGQSRSDALRQRRQQSSQQRVKEVRQQVTQPAAQTRTATTTVRRTSPYAVPNTSATRSTSVRKLHYAHSANGVEVRMPAMPSIQFNWQAGSLVVAFCLIIGVILLTSLSAFQVSAVQLSGSKRITAAQVTNVVVAKRQSIFMLDSRQIIPAIQASFPEFSSVNLSIHFPSTVALSVKERQPILAWKSNGKTVWIASDGVVMPARGDGGSLQTVDSGVAIPSTKVNPGGSPLVVATPDPTADSGTTQKTAAAKKIPTIRVADAQIVQAAISLTAQLPSGASLVYDPVSGMGWNDPQGWQVFFGVDLSNLALKEAEYQAISQRLKALGIQPKLISVAHVDSPYYRTE
jgi:hypothetical protein